MIPPVTMLPCFMPPGAISDPGWTSDRSRKHGKEATECCNKSEVYREKTLPITTKPIL